MLLPVGEKGGRVLEETQETEEIIGRVATLDIGKAELVCCVRVPSPDTPGRRLQEVRTYATMTRSLLVLADRLRALGHQTSATTVGPAPDIPSGDSWRTGMRNCRGPE